MENASKALIMAGGVLIGIMVLTLWVYLFMSFGAQSEEMYGKIEEQQKVEYNAQYTIYDGRDDITIYDIISVANLAYENNKKYENYETYEDEYKISVKLKGIEIANGQMDMSKLLENYANVNGNTGELTNKFKCKITGYNSSGKINGVSFY